MRDLSLIFVSFNIQDMYPMFKLHLNLKFWLMNVFKLLRRSVRSSNPIQLPEYIYQRENKGIYDV